jgi:hypothetical protein
MHLGNPVMRSYYKNGFAKHYVRDHCCPRQDRVVPKVAEGKGLESAATQISD